MKSKASSLILFLLGVIGILYALNLIGIIHFGPRVKPGGATHDGTITTQSIRIAVAPYQDTTLFLYGNKKGVFRDLGIELEVSNVGWSEQIDTVAAGGADITMATLDEVVSKSRNLNAINKSVVYFLPGWQFNGLTVACRPEIASLAELRLRFDEKNARIEFVNQLKGKILAIPEGSVFEQPIRRLITSTGNDPSQFRFVNTTVEAGLNGLGDSSVAIAAIGNNERPEAKRRGYKFALEAADMDVLVITGFVTSRAFYEKNKPLVNNFARGWYSSVGLALSTPKENYKTVREYMDARGAKAPSFDDAMLALTHNRFPQNSLEAQKLFLDPSSQFFWNKCWNLAVENLKNTGKADQIPADASAFVAGEVIASLNSEDR